MNSINTANLSSPEDKLNWVFNVFDGDGGGTIDSNEINTMMVGLFEMSGAEVDEASTHRMKTRDKDRGFASKANTKHATRSHQARKTCTV